MPIREIRGFLFQREAEFLIFRHSLPESSLSPEKQRELYRLFTQYIDHNKYTRENALELYINISSTLCTHNHELDWMRMTLDRPGYLTAKSTTLIDGPLAHIMRWFNKHYLVWLPLGIEPFQRSVPRCADEIVAELTSSFVSEMSTQIAINRGLTAHLQSNVQTLANTSEELKIYTATLQAENRIQLSALLGRMLTAPQKFTTGRSHHEITLDERLTWLNAKRPILQDCTDLLRLKASQLPGSDPRSEGKSSAARVN